MPNDLAALLAKGYVLGPDGQLRQAHPVATRVQDAKSQRTPGSAVVQAPPDESGSGPRVTLRITRFGRQLLDFDNCAGGCKAICDQLRYAGVIEDDTPEAIDFQVRQVKIKTKQEEGTLIEVFYDLADFI